MLTFKDKKECVLVCAGEELLSAACRGFPLLLRQSAQCLLGLLAFPEPSRLLGAELQGTGTP